MKNILVLTSAYPAEDFPQDTTPVVHYFTREWTKHGYRVKVVHNLRHYPRSVYFFIKIFKNIISKYYKFLFRTKGFTEEKHYVADDVEVHRLPILKLFPLFLYTKTEQKKQLDKIISLLKSEQFEPDIIIGHWANPQLNQVIGLGELFNARTCVVMHTDVKIIKKMYKGKSKEIIDSIDVWGFRSNEIKRKFESIYGKVGNSFICYSGIPANNIKRKKRTFENGIKNFLFVGLLIKRKYPTVLLKAVHDAMKGQDFHITMIGQGPEEKKIRKLAKELKIEENVTLPGRVSREEVFKKMQEADIFVMVSKPETFGLVYLEAMSRGCITIGSKNEGIDGVIQHGTNGFLSKAGDPEKLSELLKQISKLSPNELLTVSNNAIKTASELTDEKAAKRYIEFVVEPK